MQSGPMEVEDAKTKRPLALDSSEERVGVACERVGVVWCEAADSGIDMTDAVRVAVEVSSSSLRADLPTGVKALVSLFWRCLVRG